ncbi:ABC transporter ATP-binding protein [Candidatus Saccharibacteria bacterium]|nr:ABC transporter ATP-binding protein [Candidatus Saccharibacteria bacterium]
MIDSAPAIATFGLGKRYPSSDRYAVKDLNLNILPGEIYGFLGPNGAGKSTTIRLLMNFIQPTEGHALVSNLNVVSQSPAVKKAVGYLAGEVALYNKMTGAQFLEYMAALQPPKHRRYQRDLARLFRLDLNMKIGQLSRGNRQKIGLIQALMHEPEVLILDEPTAGLDPLMQEVFFEMVRAGKKQGATFFISSHNLSEVQKMCDRVGFIRDGKLIAEQTIVELASQALQTYNISFADATPLAELRAIPTARLKINTPRHVTVRIKGDLKPLFLVLARHKVIGLGREEANLEEEFLRFYRGGKR